MTARDPFLRVVALALATTLLLLAGVLATGAAAPGQVAPGGPEVGGGADVGESGLTYWVWEQSTLWNIPRTVPATVSVSAATPTRLAAAGANYGLGPSTAGDLGVRWQFEETAGAPVSAEFELRVTVGLGSSTTHLTVYLETQRVPPAAALTFYLFWDAGGTVPSGITVATLQVEALGCPGVGTCP